MRSDIFGEWLEYINSGFRAQNRKVLLLIDNASSHFNSDARVTDDNLNLSHVRVHFLPPNTTAHLQPIDAGIIKNFKAIYKQHYIRHIIHQFETNVDLKRYLFYYFPRSTELSNLSQNATVFILITVSLNSLNKNI